MKKYILFPIILMVVLVFGSEPKNKHLLFDDTMNVSGEDSATTFVPLYQEILRPQFHITARQWFGNKLNPPRCADGWLNDLNGMVFYDGEYHVFAQRWATAWLHWVSRDLIHWTELKPVFNELEKKWYGIQSGSAVIDKNNSSGLATNKNIAPMVAFFASGQHKQADGTSHAVQCMVYSNDKGRTWTEYDKNPVLPDAERDPKVFWYEPAQKWIMVIWGPPGGYVFYSSKNLKDWKKLSFLPDYFECPDMFSLPLDGDKNRVKWVVVNGDGTYVVGSFDGTTFQPETQRAPSCGGPDYYATQTFNNTEAADGRRIQLAWLRRGSWPNELNYPKDMPFNQQMTIQCQLTLKSYHGTMRLFRFPIKEIETLHGKEQKWKNKTVAFGEELILGTGDLYHLKTELEMTDGSEVEIHFRGEIIRIRNGNIGVGQQDLSFLMPKYLTGKQTPIALKTLDILLDRSSVEVFGNKGEVSLSSVLLPTGNDFTVKCTKGKVKFHNLSVFEMGSIWQGEMGINNK